MTRHIPPVDDDNLIEHLRGSLDPIQTFHLSPSGGITDLVNSLAKRETYHRYAKTFASILKYSLLAVQRYCQGDAQFDATAKRDFKFKFHTSDRLMLDACQCLHRLCSDLHHAEAWSGRHLQLYTYLWITKEKTDYFVPSKRPWRYEALLRQLTDPDFVSRHQPSTKSCSLGQTTWLSIILDLLDGRVKASDVRRALGYTNSYESSASAGQPLTPTPTPWLKRKRDVHPVSDADATESTPCPKRKRLDNDADVSDLLLSGQRNWSLNAQLGVSPGKALKRKHVEDGREDQPETSPRKRARFFNEGHLRPSPALACPLSFKSASANAIMQGRNIDEPYQGKRSRPGGTIGGAEDQPRIAPNATKAVSLGDSLRIDVELLAGELKDRCECIQIGKHGTNIPVANCDWKSIQRLAPDTWFNDTLIDAVPGLVAATVDSGTFLLSSFLYALHLKDGDFEGANRWVKRLPRDRSRWVFGICEATHWVAVEINWECALIRYYDPKDQTDYALRSKRLAQRVEAWANHLCCVNDDHTRIWQLEQLQGPKQRVDDEDNCGVYVSWLLSALVQGIRVDEDSILDPLAFRKEIVHFMRRAPRQSIHAIADDAGGDLNDSVIETICRKIEAAPTSRTTLKAKLETMDGGDEIKDGKKVPSLRNTYDPVAPTVCQFPRDEYASTLQSFNPTHWQKREAVGLPSENVSGIGNRHSVPSISSIFDTTNDLASPAGWNMDVVSQEEVRTALPGGNISLRLEIPTVSNVPRAGASGISSGQLSPDSEAPRLLSQVHSTGGIAIAVDHDDERTRQTIPSQSLQDRDCAGEELEQYFSAYQTNATGELPNFNLPGLSPSDGGFTMHQLPHPVSQDYEIGLDNVDLTNSHRLMSTNESWPHDHPTYVEDVIQRNYEFMVNLPYDYDHLSVDGGIQGKEQGHNSPSLAISIQDTIQQNLHDRLSAPNVHDIVRRDYASMFDI